ncbi:MAG: FTR1 family protein [Alphaproteobacteria bacterium]|nr:FTR1 family protein [Alphaproteobacteria bacterium]
MLSSAIVVFREVFEIVLIVGIVLAATRGMPGRGCAIALGFGGGIAGSALVALFTESISAMAEGVGQEIFNAGVLFTAAGFIGWTILWMKRHAREMKGQFARLGQDVANGKISYLVLSAVIALAVLREGSEIVLFTYGMLAAGQSPALLLTGSATGLVAGAGIGMLLYLGLIRLSVRVFMQVTSWMLVLLVAGMMSQGIGFLVAAGIFEKFTNVVWDSSWLLSEQGIVGQSLGTLIGYTARPMAIQIFVYLLTLGTLVMFMKLIDYKSLSAMRASAAALAILALLFPTQAQATKKVYSPYVEKGELELEWRGGLTHDDDDDEADGAWEQKLGIGYGFTERLFLEVYGEVEKENEESAEFTAAELEAKVQLTDPGEYWLDVGLLGEYKYNTADGADKIEGQLLLAKDVGSFMHLANLVLEREVGDDSEDETEGGISWSSRYRYNEAFEPGLEIYSEFGELSDMGEFDDQGHSLGPVVYGKVGSFKYDVGYLIGLSDSAPDGTFKAILEYEWHF